MKPVFFIILIVLISTNSFNTSSDKKQEKRISDDVEQIEPTSYATVDSLNTDSLAHYGYQSR